MKILVRYSILILSLLIIFTIPDYNKSEVKRLNLTQGKGSPNVPKSMIMYEMIEKYSDIYEIPKHIAYNIAYKETRYRGPFHWDYVPEQGSSALGPMQIIPSTARSIYKLMGFEDQISNDDLRNDIELNVMISMKILSRSYESCGNWSIVCGKYNTGKEVINEYAIYCSGHKDYKDNWISHE
jgi:soluble lytic murein transglycosylase-like protein